MRTPGSLVGHLEPIWNPPESKQLDYEGEIVLVIGKAGRRIAAADAWQHVAGLTLMNEGSVRDWLRHSKFNVTPGKNFERSGSLGPWLVTADELAPGAELHLMTRVNGELRQDDTTANLIFPFARLIEYLSSFMRLTPGDLIATGTPTGAGARFDPPKYLRGGDTVEVHVPEIGTLRNVVVDEPPAPERRGRAMPFLILILALLALTVGPGPVGAGRHAPLPRARQPLPAHGRPNRAPACSTRSACATSPRRSRSTAITTIRSRRPCGSRPTTSTAAR